MISSHGASSPSPETPAVSSASPLPRRVPPRATARHSDRNRSAAKTAPGKGGGPTKRAAPKTSGKPQTKHTAGMNKTATPKTASQKTATAKASAPKGAARSAAAPKGTAKTAAAKKAAAPLAKKAVAKKAAPTKTSRPTAKKAPSQKAAAQKTTPAAQKKSAARRR
jgi:hypothetical protein